MGENNDANASVSEILAALSFALDMTEGQIRGHSVRTGMIADRIAEVLGLEDGLRDNLFYSSLLKDSGCSNNSARIHKIFGGDDFAIKRKVKLVDWSSPVQSVKFALGNMAIGSGVVEKLVKMVGMAGPPAKLMDEVTSARCTRGAAIALKLGFEMDVASAVQGLDEHWDGKGSPRHLKGDEIPLLARIIGIAQTLEVFVTAYGVEAGKDMILARSGRWFDPEVAMAAIAVCDDGAFWQSHAEHIQSGNVLLEPSKVTKQANASIDSICEAFANIVDAKSTFTGEHSTRVTKYAVDLAEFFELGDERVSTIRRAALLHDIGKLGVPNSILDKPGKLTEKEFERVKLHPKLSYEILKPIRGFDRITELAANHHERIDGLGYWRGLAAENLDLDMRIIATADVFDALSAERPYRGALPLAEVFCMMRREAGRALDEDCVEGLDEIYAPWEYAWEAA